MRSEPRAQLPHRKFAVDAPLWTHEEGRLGLTLQLRFTEIAPEAYLTEIDDLHVL